jgi:molecular chaperone DnaK
MLESKGTTHHRPNFELVNVNSHSLGVVGRDPATGKQVNVILIPKNTPLPCQKQRRFQTAQADQRTVKVPIVEGESQRPEHCIALGECVIRNLPPGLPKGSRIVVNYYYAANGRISVAARVLQTRQSAHVELERQQARDLQDLETWRKLLLGASAVSPDG